MWVSGVCDAMLTRWSVVIVLVEITLCQESTWKMAGESHNTKRNESLSSCVSAYQLPTNTSGPCYVYNNTKGYCWPSRGHQLVFGSLLEQDEIEQNLGELIHSLQSFVGLTGPCLVVLKEVYCHQYFPRCDNTTNKLVPQPLCRESCSLVSRRCKSSRSKATHGEDRQSFSISSHKLGIPILNCTILPRRHAGTLSECYYINELNSKKDKKRSESCFFGNGMGYHGNINVTRSGIACQSWSSKCPHRHWRSPETFPQLLNASNSCRNPGGEGPWGPWCYTTDPRVRWEYCDVPRCKHKPTPPRGIPRPPRSVQAFTVNSTTIRVIWKPVAETSSSIDMQGYLVFYSVAGSNIYQSIECDCRQVLITKLQPSTSYSVRLMASYKYGNSPSSDVIYIATLPQNFATPVDVPIGLKAFPVNSTCIRVFWTPLYHGDHPHGNIRGYRVFFQATEGDHMSNFKTSANITGILIIGLRPSTNYSVHVWALNKQGVEKRSPITFVRTPDQMRNSTNGTYNKTWFGASSGLVIKTWWVVIPLCVTLFSAVCLSLYCFVLKRRSCWRPTDMSDVTSSDRNREVTVVSHRERLETNVDNGDVEPSHTPSDNNVIRNSDVIVEAIHGNSDVTVSCGHSNQDVTEPGQINSACDVVHDVVLDVAYDAVYDVFICYSSKDTAWVGELVEELERRGFRCCVDYRDFVPGAAIVENIADAIYGSRKTIAVLSPDFLRSNWCQHELRQALTRVDVHAVVPVVYRACHVPVLLRDRTYVDWENAHGRPYFWDNLEKALEA